MIKDKSQPMVYLLIALASIFIITWGIQASAAILNPILLAAIITVVVLPLPHYLAQRGLPSWLSFVLTLLLVVGGLAALVLLMFFAFANMTEGFVNQVESLGQFSGQSGDSPNPAIGSFVAGLIGWLGSVVVQMGMVALIFMFMLGAALAAPSRSKLDANTVSLMTQVTRLTADMRRYMSIMTGINFMVGLGDVLLLWLVGVEYAIVWGLLSWIMGYIPTIGFWIALIPPVLIAYSTLGVKAALIVLAGYVLINGSVQNFIQPRMMGQGLGISPLVVFISLFVWGWLLGAIGAILAVPLTMIIMAFLHYFPTTRWIAVLMSTPKKDNNDAHESARGKLQGLWQRTKHAVRGDSSGEDDDVDNTEPTSQKPDNGDAAADESEATAVAGLQSDQAVNDSKS